MDRLVQEGEFWTVYRHSDTWGDCPLFKTKDKELAKKIFNI